MNSERPQPPALAVFLLRHLCPKDRQEALTGDLFERFGEDLLVLGGPLYMIDDEPVNRSPARFEFEA
jgi:hypothetical protein